MRKDQVKLSNLNGINNIIYAGTFATHMQHGHHSGQTHSGLHVVASFLKNGNNLPIAAPDIVTGAVIQGTVNGRAATLTVSAVDARTRCFKASVNIYGTAKVSTFFPAGTSLATAQGYIQAAWRDHCTYGTTAHGGGDVDIYKQMRAAFGLNWVGMATIGGQQTWIGSALSGSLVTAFPAVNNKFM